MRIIRTTLYLSAAAAIIASLPTTIRGVKSIREAISDHQYRRKLMREMTAWQSAKPIPKD